MAPSSRPKSGLSPEEALANWSDRDELDAMTEYADAADHILATPEGERRHQEYKTRRNKLEATFLERVRSGELLASGISQDEKERTVIPLAVWELLDINYDSNSVSGRGRLYENVEFFEPGAIPLNVSDIPQWVAKLPGYEAPLAGEPQDRAQIPIVFAIDGQTVLFNGGIRVSGAGAKLIVELLATYDQSACTQNEPMTTKPAKQRPIPQDELATVLTISEQAARQLISRTRAELDAQFKDRFGVNLGRNDVIQNLPGKGYRLNPRIICAKPFQLEPL